MGKLTAKQVENAGPGMHADGDGLYLQVGTGAARSWIFRFKAKGKERYLGLGSATAIPLKRARELAAAARQLRAEGTDPLAAREEKRQAERIDSIKRTSFKECAERYQTAHEIGWKNPKHRQQWRNTLATYAYPILGPVPVQQVDTALVLEVLEPIWPDKPETASRVRGRIETVLDWASARGLRQGDNPARWRGHLKHMLPARSKVRAVKHHAALPYGELPAFMAALRTRPSISARALEFVILTAVRTGEARGARWGEINLTTGVWTIPAARMKAGKEHRVPLSAEAVAVLQSLPRNDEADDDNEWVFPGHKGSLTEAALSKMLAIMGRGDITVHGFRSSFSDWVSEETNFPDVLAEAALAHVKGDKVKEAYKRGTMFEKRRRLMEAWAKYCCKAPAASADNVVVFCGGR
jgi:integrase